MVGGRARWASGFRSYRHTSGSRRRQGVVARRHDAERLGAVVKEQVDDREMGYEWAEELSVGRVTIVLEGHPDTLALEPTDIEILLTGSTFIELCRAEPETNRDEAFVPLDQRNAQRGRANRRPLQSHVTGERHGRG